MHRVMRESGAHLFPQISFCFLSQCLNSRRNCRRKKYIFQDFFFLMKWEGLAFQWLVHCTSKTVVLTELLLQNFHGRYYFLPSSPPPEIEEQKSAQTGLLSRFFSFKVRACLFPVPATCLRSLCVGLEILWAQSIKMSVKGTRDYF